MHIRAIFNAIFKTISIDSIYNKNYKFCRSHADKHAHWNTDSLSMHLQRALVALPKMLEFY